MTRLFNNTTGKFRRSILLAVGIGAGLAGFASTARADERYGDRYGRDYRYGDERRYDRRERSDVRVDIDVNLGGHSRPHYAERRVRHWVEPVYRRTSERVWVEPVYKCVTERVWVAPVYRTVYEEVYSPARYEVREIVRYEHGRRCLLRERYLIEPACTRRVARQVCVAPGHWDTVERRVCVAEGHWDVVERNVCVSEGRWDYRTERVELSSHEQHSGLGIRF
jgi:hypothetical protein